MVFNFFVFLLVITLVSIGLLWAAILLMEDINKGDSDENY